MRFNLRFCAIFAIKMFLYRSKVQLQTEVHKILKEIEIMVKIRPQKPVTFGDVKLNENEIESKNTVKENGATRYVVNFKNGSTIKYPQQAKRNNAEINSEHYLGVGDTESYVVQTDINRLFGAEFTGGNHIDLVHLNGCNNCKVDVSDDGSINDLGDTVYIYDDYKSKYKSKNNTIKQDRYDTTNIFADKDIITVKGEGTHIEE